MRISLALFLVPIVLISCEPTEPTSSVSVVDIGTHRLEVRSAGSGAPAVVIDAGIGDSMDRLSSLQDRIADETSVIAYNRAGYGHSEAGPLPRSARREAEELRLMLKAMSVSPPYLLVGHSLGGLNAQMFAAMYPEEVSGLVLLDPPPLPFILGQEYPRLADMAEQMTAQWQAGADNLARSQDEAEKRQAVFLAAIASEHREMFSSSAAEVDAIASFGDIPVVVIASGVPNAAFGDVADEFQKFWIEQSQAVSQKSSRGQFILAGESSHHIYEDAPDIVAGAILDLVKSRRSK